jgi:TRAP-type C4-dicarboxylate transport system permease large subunit
MILRTVSIFFPVTAAIGYDSIWFGVIIVMVQIGLIAPPMRVTCICLSPDL